VLDVDLELSAHHGPSLRPGLLGPVVGELAGFVLRHLGRVAKDVRLSTARRRTLRRPTSALPSATPKSCGGLDSLQVVRRRSFGLHLALAIVVPACGALTWWQLERALGGNTLSWVYTVEWPFFAGYAAWMWWRLLHEEGTAPDEDAAIAVGSSGGANSAGTRGAEQFFATAQQAVATGRADGGPLGDAALASLPEATRADGGVRARASLGPGLGNAARSVPVVARFEGTARRGAGEGSEAEEEEDEELAAYNRYLLELARHGPPKQFFARRRTS
jgi:hypothetical protein